MDEDGRLTPKQQAELHAKAFVIVNEEDIIADICELAEADGTDPEPVIAELERLLEQWDKDCEGFSQWTRNEEV